jgi:hypothetical protein
LKVGKVYRLEITLGHGDRGRRKREGEEKRGKKKNDLTFSFKRYLYAHQGSGNTKRGYIYYVVFGLARFLQAK